MYTWGLCLVQINNCVRKNKTLELKIEIKTRSWRKVRAKTEEIDLWATQKDEKNLWEGHDNDDETLYPYIHSANKTNKKT